MVDPSGMIGHHPNYGIAAARHVIAVDVGERAADIDPTSRDITFFLAPSALR
jgi:hypothetical protein